jgi:hypothetical protein
MVTTPAAEANLLQYLNLGFNHQGKIGKQYQSGSMEVQPHPRLRLASMSPNMPQHTVGPLGGTPLVKVPTRA